RYLARHQGRVERVTGSESDRLAQLGNKLPTAVVGRPEVPQSRVRAGFTEGEHRESAGGRPGHVRRSEVNAVDEVGRRRNSAFLKCDHERIRLLAGATG